MYLHLIIWSTRVSVNKFGCFRQTVWHLAFPSDTISFLRMNGCRQRYAEWLLALILGACSLWQVEEVLVKFIEGSTTTTLEKQHNDHLPLPKVAICMKRRYNYGALAAMGLPDDYFSENRHRTEFEMESPFPDLNQTWLKATWSREDVQMAPATGATHTGATILNNTEGILILELPDLQQ